MGPHSPLPGCGSSAAPRPRPPFGPQTSPRGTACGWGAPDRVLSCPWDPRFPSATFLCQDAPAWGSCQPPSRVASGTGKPRSRGAASLHLLSQTKFSEPEQPPDTADTAEDGARGIEVGSQGEKSSYPFRENRTRYRVASWAKPLLSPRTWPQAPSTAVQTVGPGQRRQPGPATPTSRSP